MNGKNKCKILKEIRREIAKQNDIEFFTEECKYKGECTGTCPKCEAEVRYLEKELEKRQALGKKIAVAGLAATLAVSASGCSLYERITKGPELGGLIPATEYSELQGDIALPLEGEVIPAESETEVLQGKFFPAESGDTSSNTDICDPGVIEAPNNTEDEDDTQVPETTAPETVPPLMGDPVMPQ